MMKSNPFDTMDETAFPRIPGSFNKHDLCSNDNEKDTNVPLSVKSNCGGHVQIIMNTI